jgi:hypothetical protein
MQTVEDDTDLPLAVAEARGTYATAVKHYADLSPQLATMVTAEANRQHMLVWANATLYPAKPSEGVSAGVDVVSHACLLVRETQDHGHGWGEPHFARDTDKKVMAAKTHSQVGRLTMTLQIDNDATDAVNVAINLRDDALETADAYREYAEAEYLRFSVASSILYTVG